MSHTQAHAPTHSWPQVIATVLRTRRQTSFPAPHAISKMMDLCQGQAADGKSSKDDVLAKLLTSLFPDYHEISAQKPQAECMPCTVPSPTNVSATSADAPKRATYMMLSAPPTASPPACLVSAEILQGRTTDKPQIASNNINV